MKNMVIKLLVLEVSNLFLTKGFIIGLSIAAPVGAIGVLCIQRTLNSGRLIGFVSGLGAATADAVYGAIVAFGLSFIANFLISYEILIRLFGGLFLCYLGIRTFSSKPSNNHMIAAVEMNGLRAYSSTFLLTLTNPMTIIMFTGIFAGIGLISVDGGGYGGLSLVMGVFLGSAFWWMLLSTGIGMIRDKLNRDSLLWINKISGMIILTFGLISLWKSMGY